MKYSIFILLLNIFLLTACTRTSKLLKYDNQSRSVKKLNYLGKTRTGYIELNTGELIKSDYLQLRSDSLIYVCENLKNYKHLKIDKIQRIYFEDHIVSMSDGFYIGFFSGFLGCSFYIGGDTDTDMIGLAYLGSGICGSLLGSIIGLSKGTKLEYKFIHSNRKIGKDSLE